MSNVDVKIPYLDRLVSLGESDHIISFSRLGIAPVNILGVTIPEIRKLAKSIGQDYRAALLLFDTNIRDAQILAALICDPELVDLSQMKNWATKSTSWDVVDAVCMNLFWQVRDLDKFIIYSYQSDKELVKRYAPVLMACQLRYKPDMTQDQITRILNQTTPYLTDGRNYIKKAHSWVYRELWKRHKVFQRDVEKFIIENYDSGNPVLRWIARDIARKIKTLKKISKCVF